ncbi:threalose-6-phosphate phosphatase [Apophysomyces ossiformis]|uniref:Trehalose 6-phosphate phosphatase n=1 Tax=Apophysomyces ossiformis TaxID=679940 RepID=A0A8H7EQY9_9FUNG|nr:threalose-6-phosphate phosphatase [Apophysomyces ossiformis]KAF7727563.1 threalose-6-phosphate phosphatase [Apophysomyces ossiformis]
MSSSSILPPVNTTTAALEKSHTQPYRPPNTPPLNTTILSNAYKSAKRRLFLFDYDGTLTPIVRNPADARPTPSLLRDLDALCKDPANTVWIISGRDQNFLSTYFGNIHRLGLSAEHGSFMKMGNQWVDMLQDADMSWKDDALQIFEKYTSQTPGTVIEQKKSSITWHYRNAHHLEEAIRQVDQCRHELHRIPGVDILVGKMNVEVRSHLVNKGEVVMRIRSQVPADFILCAGDDRTDEDMFKTLRDDKRAFTVLVGPPTRETYAGSCVGSSEEVVALLSSMVPQSASM